jgi:hypothetical protein
VTPALRTSIALSLRWQTGQPRRNAPRPSSDTEWTKHSPSCRAPTPILFQQGPPSKIGGPSLPQVGGPFRQALNLKRMFRRQCRKRQGRPACTHVPRDPWSSGGWHLSGARGTMVLAWTMIQASGHTPSAGSPWSNRRWANPPPRSRQPHPKQTREPFRGSHRALTVCSSALCSNPDPTVDTGTDRTRFIEDVRSAMTAPEQKVMRGRIELLPITADCGIA